MENTSNGAENASNLGNPLHELGSGTSSSGDSNSSRENQSPESPQSPPPSSNDNSATPPLDPSIPSQFADILEAGLAAAFSNGIPSHSNVNPATPPSLPPQIAAMLQAGLAAAFSNGIPSHPNTNMSQSNPPTNPPSLPPQISAMLQAGLAAGAGIPSHPVNNVNQSNPSAPSNPFTPLPYGRPAPANSNRENQYQPNINVNQIPFNPALFAAMLGAAGNQNGEFSFSFSTDQHPETANQFASFFQRMDSNHGGSLDSFFAEMFQQLNPNNATSKAAIEGFEKIIITESCDVNCSTFSVKQLKRFLTALEVDFSTFLEKQLFLEALSRKVLFKPLEDSCFQTCQTCTICASEIKVGDLLMKLPCGHWFHIGLGEETTKIDDDDCPGVSKWLSKNSTCPNCKLELPKQRDHVDVPKVVPEAAEADGMEHTRPNLSPPDSNKRQKST